MRALAVGHATALRDIELGGAPLARTVFDTDAPQFLASAARKNRATPLD